MEIVTLTTIETERLSALESTIEQGLQTFVEVGNALMEIRDSRLYRATFGTFEGYCRERWGMVRRQADRLIQAAEVVENLRPMGLEIPLNERQVRPLVGLSSEQQLTVWPLVVESAPNGKITAAHVQKTVDEYTQADSQEFDYDSHLDAALADESKPVCQSCGQVYDGPRCPDCHKADPIPSSMAVHYSSETPEWYTPAHIIERVVKVLREIDLDPCSSPGEPNVPAHNHYTQEDDGLSKAWNGRVYMNPPYGREIKDWVNYLVTEFEKGNVSEAIALVPARTDTEWFRALETFPRCFVYGRLVFSGYDNSAPFPSMAVYLGSNSDSFKAAFRDLGGIYKLDE